MPWIFFRDIDGPSQRPYKDTKTFSIKIPGFSLRGCVWSGDIRLLVAKGLNLDFVYSPRFTDVDNPVR